jgi:hypothetical protein
VVTVLPDNNRFVAIAAVPIPEVFAVAIAITVTMTFTDGHAIGTYTDSDFFRSGGNGAANSHHGGYGYCVLDHLRAPINVKPWSQSPAATNVPARRENTSDATRSALTASANNPGKAGTAGDRRPHSRNFGSEQY